MGYNRQGGGEILLVRGYRDDREDRYGSGLGLVLFKLVVTLLQPRVMGSYLIRSERLLSRSTAGKSRDVSRFSRL
jgi:hypothetical protein